MRLGSKFTNSNLLFITGTNTCVGKTLLTGLLLLHLRQAGCHALALKPFCSGGRGDARLLARLQDGELSLNQVNPVFFRESVAPGVAAKLRGQSMPLRRIIAHIYRIRARCDFLLVEGAGGVLSPWGIDFTMADLLRAMRARVVVVAANELGAINHVLLTVHELQHVGIRDIIVVLMGRNRSGLAVRTNAKVLSEWLPSTRVVTVPYLGEKAVQMEVFENNCKKIQKTLAQILGDVSVLNTVRAKSSGTDREEIKIVLKKV